MIYFIEIYCQKTQQGDISVSLDVGITMQPN